MTDQIQPPWTPQLTALQSCASGNQFPGNISHDRKISNVSFSGCLRQDPKAINLFKETYIASRYGASLKLEEEAHAQQRVGKCRTSSLPGELKIPDVTVADFLGIYSSSQPV